MSWHIVTTVADPLPCADRQALRLVLLLMCHAALLLLYLCRDQSRMWEQRLPGYGHLNKLMPDVVFSWSSNFSMLLSSTTELLPEVRAATLSDTVITCCCRGCVGSLP